MPELPEVELTRRSIAPLLERRTITSVHKTAPSSFFLTPPAILGKRLVGRRVLALLRHGKYLRALLDSGETLVLHLGMTGEIFAGGKASTDRHTHLRLGFADGGPEVLFHDARKFGRVLLLPPGGTDPRLERLGPDALVATGEELFEAARARRIPIKTLLLDQSVLAGIGNIYADEGLFLAGVRPTRASRRVPRSQCRAIVETCRRVMLRSIASRGQLSRKVYGRAGEPCLVCRAKIQRVVLGQRSAHFCPRCQT